MFHIGFRLSACLRARLGSAMSRTFSSGDRSWSVSLRQRRVLLVNDALVRRPCLRKELDAMHSEVSAGSSLAAAFQKRPLFPSMIANLISVGEEGGKLEHALGRIAGAYERDTRRSVSVLTSLLEPAMILFMGSVVGFIVISMLLPIFELNVLMR